MDDSSNMDCRIFLLLEKVNDNLGHEWTVEEMAEMVKLSASHLQRIFKQELGVPPIAFVQNARLEKARELLESSLLQVKQIGNTVGLPHDSHLTRYFKKKFGVTPTEYRRQHWQRIQADGATRTLIIEFAKK